MKHGLSNTASSLLKVFDVTCFQTPYKILCPPDRERKDLKEEAPDSGMHSPIDIPL
jgi:hypothetical protein